MSIYCANELQVQIFQHMREFLSPFGKTLPAPNCELRQALRGAIRRKHPPLPDGVYAAPIDVLDAAILS